jgi:hypothetical protein
MKNGMMIQCSQSQGGVRKSCIPLHKDGTGTNRDECVTVFRHDHMNTLCLLSRPSRFEKGLQPASRTQKPTTCKTHEQLNACDGSGLWCFKRSLEYLYLYVHAYIVELVVAFGLRVTVIANNIGKQFHGPLFHHC